MLGDPSHHGHHDQCTACKSSCDSGSMVVSKIIRPRVSQGGDSDWCARERGEARGAVAGAVIVQPP